MKRVDVIGWALMVAYLGFVAWCACQALGQIKHDRVVAAQRAALDGPVVVLPAAQIQAMGCLTMGVPSVHQTIDAVVDRTVPRVYVSDKIDCKVPHDTMMGRCGGTIVIVRAEP